ncbi:MAG: hypothetical protein JNM00_10955 [Flavobacteriales bacterium]|nr:hypothetical protein [Flavobacteriales bacterium]
MTFLQRLSRYLIGFGIGLIIVWIMFGDRDWFGWTPGNRVVTKITTEHLFISTKAACQLDCLAIPDTMVKPMVKEMRVNFSASKPRQTPKEYVLYGKVDKALKAVFHTADTASTLVEISKEGKLCDCK